MKSQNANAYLLFYKRRSDLPVGGKTFEKIEAARQKIATVEAETISQANLPTPPEDTDEEPPRFMSGLFAKLDRSKNASTSSLTPQFGQDDDRPELDSDQDGPFGDRFSLNKAAPRRRKPSPSSSNAADSGDDVGNLSEMEFDEDEVPDEDADKTEDLDREEDKLRTNISKAGAK